MTKKLLLADDSITIQKVIGIIFETEDYQLLVTDNGDDALTQALAERPDLVIADISMPGKDGFELCQAIKSNPRLPDTTVLLLPGTFDHFDEQRALAVGADGWLKKPFESQALLDKVAQLLEAEPIRLPGEQSASVTSVPPALEESPADFAFAAAADAEDGSSFAPDVDEVVLGLDELDVSGVGEELAETAADDIWDSVSFADDDLSPPAETADAADGLADFSFADSAVEESLTEEPVLAGSLEPLAEDLEPSAFAAASGVDTEELESLNLAEETADVEDFVAPEALHPLSVAAAEDFSTATSFAPEEDEEIFELADEDIYAEAPPVDDLVAADSELIELADEDVVAEENYSFADEGDFVAPGTVLPVDLVTPETGAAEEFEAPLVFEDAAIEREELSLPSAEAAHEDFAFGGSAGEEPVAADFLELEEPEEFSAEIAEPVAVTAALAPAVAVEQVEQQLRQLSDEDLQDVVARVAGPIIERLAKELLEQIAWEVVPDLAEAMIREEIRKIKHPAA